MAEVFEEQKMREIMAECARHNADIGADAREPEKLRKDAEYIFMHRQCGVSVETLCMMMTDLYFAARRGQ